MSSDGRWDRIAAAMLQRLPLEAGLDFFASPQWASLPEHLQEAIYIADAELVAMDRKARQEARQKAAEDDYRRRMAESP